MRWANFSLSQAGTALARSAFMRLDDWARRGPRFSIRRRADLTLLLDRTNLIDRCLISRRMIPGEWERKQTDYLRTQAERLALATRKPMRFLDVGAHWGYYSLLAVRWGQFASIDAFEPDPVNHAQLLAQLFLNDAVSRVVVHRLAVTDTADRFPWRPSTEHPTGNRGGVGHDPYGSLNVPAARIDDVIAAKGETIVVKIDVEGHERHALRGAKELLAGSPALLQIESHDFAEEVEALLRPLGYEKINTIHPDVYYTNVPELGGRGVAAGD